MVSVMPVYSVVSMQSTNSKEVWMEMDVPDCGAPGRYEWAEVRCIIFAVKFEAYDYWYNIVIWVIVQVLCG